MSKKFPEYPLVLDWLQWAEFEPAHTTKIDYPKAALELLAEMRGYIRGLENTIDLLTALDGFYPEPGAQAQPNLNDNPLHEDDEAW